MGGTTDAFISHASEDTEFAAKVQKRLRAARLSTWLDRSSIRFGVLLRTELLSAIQDSRVLVLLWSAAAARSRWVASELLSAYHMNRFIVPVVLDKTDLPMFLQNSVYLDLQRSEEVVLKDLPRAVKEAPDASNPILPFMGSETDELMQFVAGVNQLQMEEIGHIQKGNLDAARTFHEKLETVLQSGETAWPYQSLVLCLVGYHLKNGYMIKYDAEISAGRAPRDPLLQHAEKKFFETLFVNPEDPSGLNGQGNVLFFERELKAAEFFHERAITYAAKTGQPYPAAESDLTLVRRYLRDSAPGAGTGN